MNSLALSEWPLAHPSNFISKGTHAPAGRDVPDLT